MYRRRLPLVPFGCLLVWGCSSEPTSTLGPSRGGASTGGVSPSGGAGTLVGSGGGASGGSGGAALGGSGNATTGGAGVGIGGRSSTGGAVTSNGGLNGTGGVSTGGGGGVAGLGSGPIVPGLNNPVFRHIYTADPAALVYNDTLYVYAGRDGAAPAATNFDMPDWHVFSTKDLAHWTDHGAPLTPRSFNWAVAQAFAGHAIERGGRFYWYVPVWVLADAAFSIGVAVANSPTGPFVDAIGKPLITNAMTTATSDHDDIDPVVFIDNDGQAYMYWGNTNLYRVRLKTNMVEIDGAIEAVTATGYGEGVYLNQRNGIYYLSYPTGWPQRTGYSTSTSLASPWIWKGAISPTASSGTNHQALIEFRGEWYLFYHNANLPGGGDYRRSVALDHLYFDADGSIRPVVHTAGGVTQLLPGPFSPGRPYQFTASSSGLLLEVAEGSASGSAARQGTKTGSTAQQWELVAVGSGVYQLVNVGTRLCLDVAAGATTAGASIQQSNCVNAPRQYFRPVGTPGGAYLWVNLNSSQLLEVAAASKAAGASIDQGTYANAAHQLWTVTPG